MSKNVNIYFIIFFFKESFNRKSITTITLKKFDQYKFGKTKI